MRGPPSAPHPLLVMGCLGMLASLVLIVLLPFLLVDTMRLALTKLHMSRPAAGLAVLGIFVGGLINVPVYRVRREHEQPIESFGAFQFGGLSRTWYRVRPETVIAVNVGGCVIPSTIAAWECSHLFARGGWVVVALLIASAVNIAVCYRASFPVRGVGIAMPGLLSPLVSIAAAWLLLSPAGYADVRAPVAFVAGVLGPLVGADLLHLKDIAKVSAGILSIGGAGTFDGIVLSGVLAALLA
jgi:uncharacterized membrane protein